MAGARRAGRADPSEGWAAEGTVAIRRDVCVSGAADDWVNAFSHGTQDLYPTFLQKDHGFSAQLTGAIAILYNVGALAGGMFFGSLSERIGGSGRSFWLRVGLAMIPLYALSHSVFSLAVGAFAMQFMVQGAWGVVPAWLKRAVAGTGPGDVSGTGVSAGEPDFFAEQRDSVESRGAFRPRIRMGAGGHGGDCGLLSGSRGGVRSRVARRGFDGNVNLAASACFTELVAIC